MQRVRNLKVSDGVVFIDNVVDIFYLIGQKVSRGTLLIFPDKTVFFVDSRYIDVCKNIKGVETYLYNTDELDLYLKGQPPSTIYIDEQTLSYLRYKYLKKVAPQANLKPTTMLRDARAIKDSKELAIMERAGSLNYQGYEYARSILKEGITEKEMAWEYEKFCRERGGEELSFDTIVAFGEGSAYPHYNKGDVKLKKGMPVLMDCGITLDSYTSDMTRCFFFEKEANPSDYALWKSHFDLVKESYDKAFALAKVGEMFSVLDSAVQDIAKTNNVQEHVKHTLGHSLGLDVHEWPRITYKLPNIEIKKDMIFTIEPGLYFEGKWGIRYENTIHMTSSGPVNLTKH